MDTFNKEVLDMLKLENTLVSAVSAASLRITPITILAGLRVLVLRLRLGKPQYCATGDLQFV